MANFKPSFHFFFLFKTTKEFRGNNDRDTVVSHYLNPLIKAQYIRFRPIAWHGHISMRVELHGCRSGTVKDIYLVKTFFEAIFRDLQTQKFYFHTTNLTWYFKKWWTCIWHTKQWSFLNLSDNWVLHVIVQ